MSGLFEGPAGSFIPLLPDEWNAIPGLASGSVATITGANNINVDTPVGNVVIGLNNIINGLDAVITNTASIGDVDYPSTQGATGDVLTLTAPGTAEWLPSGGGGGAVTSVTGSTNVEVSPTTGACVVTLQPNLTELSNVQTVAATIGGVDYPEAPGMVGEVLTLTAPGTASWQPSGGGGGAVTSVTGSANVQVLPATGACVVSLQPNLSGLSSVETTGATIGGITYPDAPGMVGEALTITTPGNASWTPAPASGVTSVSSGGGSNVISISPTTGNVVITGNDTPSFNAVTCDSLLCNFLIRCGGLTCFNTIATTELRINNLYLPTADGPAGSVVTTDGADNLTLQPLPISSVTPGGPNMAINTVSGNAIVNLANDISTASVTTGTLTAGTTTYPTFPGLNGQVLTTNGSGAATWQSVTSPTTNTYTISFTTPGSPANSFLFIIAMSRWGNVVNWQAEVQSASFASCLIQTTTTQPLISTTPVDTQYRAGNSSGYQNMGITSGACFSSVAPNTLVGLRSFSWSIDNNGFIYINQVSDNSTCYSYQATNYYVPFITYMLDTTSAAYAVLAGGGGSYITPVSGV